MKRDDIIRMALEAGVKPTWIEDGGVMYWSDLHRFAALVAAHERDRMTVNLIHSCHPECDNLVCVRVREEVRAEREACAEYAAALAEAGWSAGSIADAIRGRGET